MRSLPKGNAFIRVCLYVCSREGGGAEADRQVNKFEQV